ncbi:hypothetical protein H6F39_06030 [Anabaena sp. FACHB-1250]|uniref:Uncharacterized protein n=1 Tax=Dolichospermum planctonicum TaxID=136072 RepID=A0A480ADD1_9CYAN|nr:MULTISPECIES: hypothetical protein [Nostocales]MBD2140951.1 hypothetical protein [Anabaena sp. FACHB-1250]GCL41986.1 hypothetical protein NIES80_16870 [Dolichospermum planctonicum]
MSNKKLVSSPGQNLKTLYEQVFEKVYPHINGHKKGILFTVIHLIVPENAQEILSLSNISDKASVEEDLSILSDIIDIFVSTPNGKKQQITAQFQEVFNNLLDLNKYENNDLKLFQIVVIGCLIVGASACLSFLRKAQQSPKNIPSNIPSNIPLGNSSPPQKNPQSLCLVVPASVLGGNIKENYPINISEIGKLIDNSAYFLCIEPAQADTIQNQLELTEENITNVSEQREVYIRINIADAEEIIGKKFPYILKRYLPANGIGVVRKIACLKYLSVSGLDEFNRIF